MSIPPESIGVGKCYLVRTARSGPASGVRRVLRIMPNGQIQFEHRTSAGKSAGWKVGMLDPRSFALIAQCEVPCDWSPETDEDNT